jgi:hypothetical protein
MPGWSQLALPSCQELLVAVRAQRGVALLECSLVSAPHAEEFVFHVKHAPVE